MNRKSKTTMLIILLTLALSLSVSFANMGMVKIFIDGKQIQSDVAPVIIEGRTMVPVRFIAENFGADVAWDAATQSVIITTKNIENDEGESGDPSSPILQLSESWDGVVNGIRTNMSYDQVNKKFYGTVENTTQTTLKGVLIELNLKLGTRTVVELGPHPVGDLLPGQSTQIAMYVKDEPLATGITFDAWEIHPEAENVGGSNEANESHGAESGEEGTSIGSQTLTANEVYDQSNNGGRLYLAYNQQNKAFEGFLENISAQVLTRARVEIHLDSGTELGPTTPFDLKPGQKVKISLPTNESFKTWVTHAEFGSGEGTETGGESGEGSESGGESHGNEGSGN